MTGAVAGHVIVAVALAGFGPGVAVWVQVKVAVVTAACGTQVMPIPRGAAVVRVCVALLVIVKLLGAVTGMLQANTVLPVPCAGVVIVGVTVPVPPVSVVAGTDAMGATLVTVACGQVNAQTRENGEPATVGVAVSVQVKVAVATAPPRVQLRLIEPVVVPVLKMPFAGVVVTAPNDAAPAPLIAQPVTADWPVPAAPDEVTPIVVLTLPAAPAGKVTPAAVVGLYVSVGAVAPPPTTTEPAVPVQATDPPPESVQPFGGVAKLVGVNA